MSEKPLSENIGTYEAGYYIITAAIWRTNIQGQYYNNYEIGIRSKKNGEFTLLQSDKYSYQSVQDVANAIAHILSISSEKYSGEHYTPSWFQKYMT